MGSCCTKDEFKPNTGGLPEKRTSLKIRGRIDQDESEERERTFSTDG
jgi:hypothetical protein